MPSENLSPGEYLQHPDRGLKLVSVENARDLGGYPTRAGGLTQWRRFVRTADMHELSPTDSEALADYGIRTVMDLRMTKEVEAIPNMLGTLGPPLGIELERHDFWGTRFDAYRSPDKTAHPAKKLADLYSAGLKDSGFVMGAIFSSFAEEKPGGFAFHCRSGKDRTGLVAALLLDLVGVPREIITADFALTSQYLAGEAINPIEPTAPGAWQRTCEEETMARTLQFLDAEFGGTQGYLREQGVTADALEVVGAKLLR